MRWARASADAEALLPAALALTLLDAVLTHQWLRIGVAVEANPWLASLVERFGAAPAMAVRAAVGVALLGLLACVARRAPAAERALAAVSVVLAAVVAWHVTGGVVTLALTQL